VDTKDMDGGKLSRKVTRRDVLKAGAAGAAGLGAAALGTPAMAAPAILRNARQVLKVMSWFQYEPGRNAAWATMYKEFNASQKDYKVTVTGWESQSFTTQVLIQAQAGSIDADVIHLIPDLGLRVMQMGLLAPLDDIIAKVGVHPTKAHDFMRMKGHLYGLSIVEVPFAVIYNKALLNKAGIKQPATTIDGWNQQLKMLTHKPIQYGLWEPSAPSEVFAWWFFMQQYGLAYGGVWAKGKTSLLTSAPIVKAMELWLTQYKNVEPQGTTAPQSLRLIGNGTVAETQTVSAAVNQYKVVAPKTYANIRSVAPPWQGKRSCSRLHPIGIVASTSKMDGAKAFVEFMATPENMAQLMKLCLDVVPPYPEVWKVPGFKAYMDSQFWAKGYLDIDPVPFPSVMGDYIRYNTEFGNIVTTQMQKAMLGRAAVADALAAADKQVQAQLRPRLG
jgi:ABC-type glycerol-3-phosphate transport system substrate-binding protein